MKVLFIGNAGYRGRDYQQGRVYDLPEDIYNCLKQSCTPWDETPQGKKELVQGKAQDQQPKVKGISGEVLVIMSWGIGNIINKTPFIRVLKQQQVDVDILVEDQYMDVLKGWPLIRHIYFLSEFRKMKNRPNYSVIFDTVPTGIDISVLNLQKNVVAASNGMLPKMHEIEANLEMLQREGIWDGKNVPDPVMWIPQDVKDRIKINAGKKIIAVNAGYNKDQDFWKCKNWGYARFAQLINLMKKDPRWNDYIFAIMGTGDDAKVMDGLDDRKRIMNLINEHTIQETAWFLKHCQFIICNDTGLGHIASAVGVKSYCIFGPTSTVKNHPWNHSTLITRELECRPCQFSKMWKRCTDWKCLDINPEEVHDAILGNEFKYYDHGKKYGLPFVVMPHYDFPDWKRTVDSIPGEFQRCIPQDGFFAHNCNVGAEAARKAGAEWILCINDDIILNEKALKEMIELTPDADIIGCCTVLTNGQPENFGIHITQDEGRWRFTHSDQKCVDWINPSGSCFMIRTKAWFKLGGMKEIYKNSCEDTELFFTAREKGMRFKMCFTPVIHALSKSSNRMTYASENFRLFLERFPSSRINNVLRLAREKMPLVSVVIPHLPNRKMRTSETLQLQSYKNLEVIIQYDFCGKGHGWARNRGAEKANGKYIIFIDDDIILKPTMLMKMVVALEQDQKASFAYCNYSRSGVHSGDQIAMPWDVEKLKNRNTISMISMIRRSDLIPLDESIKRLIDWDCWLTMAEAGKYGVHINEILFEAVYDSDGVTMRGPDDFRIAQALVWEKHGIKNPWCVPNAKVEI